jgi:DNA-binding GntR family transcriptional regulator
MAASPIRLRPVETGAGLKNQVYFALKDAITAMDIYGGDEPPKLDERRLAEDLGVSRTPIREALSRLAQDGLVEMIPRRGTFVARKSKSEILEIISVWAALESMAARLATQNASDAEIGQLRKLFVTFEEKNEPRAHIDEYSDTNIRFHQRIISLSKSALLKKTADALFVHMRAIRARTITERDRADRSIIDHLHIIEAIEARDTELAERLVREHCFGLADHINNYVTYLD